MAFTIYADTNIYRYLASGELLITTVGDVRFVYSHVHFNEVMRGTNTDALDGMEVLGACRMDSNENGAYNHAGAGVIFEYEQPQACFAQYQAGCDSVDTSGEDGLYEFLIRLMGAENLEELHKIPETILRIAEEATDDNDDQALIKRAEAAAEEFRQHLNGNLSETRPLPKTREEMGFPKGASSTVTNASNPIETIWEHMKDKCHGVTRDQFFGFEAIPGITENYPQSTSISACHLILNMVGFNPDKGLAKKDKIQNIISDGQHLGLASLCDSFITTDMRLHKKAEAIFKYRNIPTELTYLPYSPDKMSILVAERGAIKRFKRNKPVSP